jgi:hypothetical protein
MLATIVLYVAAIDRIALGMHMSHAQDTDAPLSKRLIACGAASNTFFFANTASSQLRTIANDKQTPDALKYRAGRNARLLTAIANPGTGPMFSSEISSSATTMQLPQAGKKHHEIQRWDISTFYHNHSHERPLMVVVRVPPRGSGTDRLDDYRILWRVISSQVDPTGKIVIISPSLKAIVVGQESDMIQTAWDARHGRLANSKIWTNLILPAVKRLGEGQP